ncbi:hypothetical protein [Tateyamaria sp. Alg231-49]|uniref:hypothetical protein n=1 Tax=Tateyamaria sp. Alg231-49 TaxID=1922219 RepID=UPI000D55C398|nr:hypothetical protein [Tateyamaria sp. Alg231-49]
MSSRRAAANSLEQQLKSAKVAASDTQHDWPNLIAIGPAGKAALDVFRAGQLSRAHEDWSPLDLIELARVSKTIVQADREQGLYEQEGTLIAGGKNGTNLVVNPRGRALSALNSQINATLRRLGITRMSVATKRGIAARADAERQMRESYSATHSGNNPDDISLI